MRRVNENCYGCASCIAVCPRKAIRLELSQDGFYVAVKTDTCVECGICERHCASIKGLSKPLSKECVYAAEPRDRRAVEGSSSGGLAYFLARKALEDGWRAFGCTYDPKIQGARHIAIGSEKELHRIQGSLYLMSDMSGIGEFVSNAKGGALFGTPCQIAGAHAVLEGKGRRQEFLLVDIFCHGVPSQIAWTRHLEHLEKKNTELKKAKYSFRDGKVYCLTGYMTDSSHRRRILYSKPCGQDGFFRLFLAGTIFNETCYACPYRRMSCADIRLGDLATGGYLNLQDPPSCAIANTERGLAALHSLKQDVRFKKIDYSVVDSVQDKGDKQPPADRGQVLHALKAGSSPDEIEQMRIKASAAKSFFTSIAGRFKTKSKQPDSIFEVEE